MIRRAILSSLVLIAAGLSGCTYHMQCGSAGCGTMPATADCGCGQAACDGGCGVGRGFGPLGFARNMSTCGAGCGRMYINEWVNDPPDNCDPCDDCGNWIGDQCCPKRFWRWANASRSLFGFRYDRPLRVAGGCGCAHHAGMHGMHEGEVIYDGPVRQGGAGEEIRPPVPEADRSSAEPMTMEARETRSIKKPWGQSSETGTTSDEYYPR
jgi:hypothetical protein